jgi:hypothetical protein
MDGERMIRSERRVADSRRTVLPYSRTNLVRRHPGIGVVQSLDLLQHGLLSISKSLWGTPCLAYGLAGLRT